MKLFQKKGNRLSVSGVLYGVAALKYRHAVLYKNGSSK